MLMGCEGLAMLETAYFDNKDKLAYALLVHMFEAEHLEELKERWETWPKYAARKRLEAQEAHQKYQPMP
jgi:hypothetical protein